MKIIEFNKANKNGPITAAIGIFDGLHKGHKKVLEELRQKGHSAVKTLQSLSDRLRNFRALGINDVIVFTGSDGILGMTASDFIKNIVVDLNIEHIVVGNDFRMGRNRESDAESLKGICKKYGIGLTIVDVVYDDGKKLSSTSIRDYVEHGDVPKAISLLGHDLELHGIVVKGKGNGAKIGFRTANIKLNSSRTLPDHGIYITRTHINGVPYPSVTFIGESPTIHKDHHYGETPLVETYLIDFNRDIYGQKIFIELIEKIREIKKFPNLIELSEAITEDVKLAVKRLHSYK
jgi:riboflavin kinase/FMN adenylyltransferase